VKKSVDILLDYAILFAVMRDDISCEEIFEASVQERAELNAWCDELDNEAIRAQEAEMEDNLRPEEEDCGWFGYEGLCED
jgi:hypothetical protein